MNRTERRYAMEVLEPQRMAGQIKRWVFEPFAIKLAPRTFYRPDFLLWLPEPCSLEIHEIKGAWTDSARVKVKVAAAANPWFRFVCVYRVKGAFAYEEVPSA